MDYWEKCNEKSLFQQKFLQSSKYGRFHGCGLHKNIEENILICMLKSILCC